MKNIEVYWAIVAKTDEFAEKALLVEEPVNLINDLSSIYNKESKVFSCPSVKNKHKNTFVYKLPFDIDASSLGGETLFSSSNNISQRKPMYENSISFDIDSQIVFFCFEELEMQTTPPYFHQTSYSQLGHSPSGQFNIGNWFRPSSPNISTYPGITFFKASAGEPIIYYHFITDKKVVLKQFLLSERLMNIMNASVNLKIKIPNQSLEALYNRFKKSKLKNIIKQEITDNLLD